MPHLVPVEVESAARADTDRNRIVKMLEHTEILFIVPKICRARTCTAIKEP